MKKYLLIIPLLVIIPSIIYAWSDHTYYTREALTVMPEITGTQNVKVEKLEDFLIKESAGLTLLLKEQEIFLKKTYPIYPKAPDALAFDGKDKSKIKVNFLRAIRVNPEIKLGYYIQAMPGTDISKKSRVNIKDISVFNDISWLDKYIITAIKPGDKASALDITATASDEPDYGNDIHLFEDNNSEFGKVYGFGEQSFGDPKLEFSSQAPFHMGYYHESFIIFLAAGFLKKTYPEERIYQYLNLAKFAFKTGHPYWGWRFLGWGLHYVQDMTQPYHTKVLPGFGTIRMLLINMSATRKAKAVDNLSDRHLSFENYIFETTRDLYQKKDLTAPIFQSLRNTENDLKYGKFDVKYTRDILSDESYSIADDLDDNISDWTDILKFSKNDYHIENFTKTKDSERIDKDVQMIMKNFGAHSRNFVRAGLSDN